MAQLGDRPTGAEARWQVRWKASRAATGRSQTFFSPLVSRGKSSAQRDAERLKAYVDLHHNACEVEEALAALGKDPRIHDLRHTHASWLIAAGRPLPSIQQRLGHLVALAQALSFGTTADSTRTAVGAARRVNT